MILSHMAGGGPIIYEISLLMFWSPSTQPPDRILLTFWFVVSCGVMIFFYYNYHREFSNRSINCLLGSLKSP